MLYNIVSSMIVFTHMYTNEGDSESPIGDTNEGGRLYALGLGSTSKHIYIVLGRGHLRWRPVRPNVTSRLELAGFHIYSS